MARPLGRNTPPDFVHVEKHPRSSATNKPRYVGVVMGVNWYDGYDNPVKGSDGKYRVKISGSVRGGHCFGTEPVADPAQPETGGDKLSWWTFYNQGEEGACVGFGNSRVLSLATRSQFDAFWLYDDARRNEGTYPDGEGSTVRSGMECLKKWGDHYQTGTVASHTKWHRGAPGVEIASFHWCVDVEEICHTLGLPATANEIPFLNSWGTEYPHRTYASREDFQRLLDEEGEAGVLVLK